MSERHGLMRKGWGDVLQPFLHLLPDGCVNGGRTRVVIARLTPLCRRWGTLSWVQAPDGSASCSGWVEPRVRANCANGSTNREAVTPPTWHRRVHSARGFAKQNPPIHEQRQFSSGRCRWRLRAMRPVFGRTNHASPTKAIVRSAGGEIAKDGARRSAPIDKRGTYTERGCANGHVVTISWRTKQHVR
jgi:hypothetical protein